MCNLSSFNIFSLSELPLLHNPKLLLFFWSVSDGPCFILLLFIFMTTYILFLYFLHSVNNSTNNNNFPRLNPVPVCSVSKCYDYNVSLTPWILEFFILISGLLIGLNSVSIGLDLVSMSQVDNGRLPAVSI